MLEVRISIFLISITEWKSLSNVIVNATRNLLAVVPAFNIEEEYYMCYFKMGVAHTIELLWACMERFNDVQPLWLEEGVVP